MSVFNWIQAEFSDRASYVSEAPEDVGREVAQLFSSPPGIRGRCELGNVRLDTASGSFVCTYLRFADESASGNRFVHAILSDAGASEPPVASVEALFRARYGTPPEPRVQALVGQLARQPVAQATLSVTELFVNAEAFERLRASTPPTTPPSKARRSPASTLPWIVATAATGVAAFLFGQTSTGSVALAPVGAPPPDDDLAQRVALLERARGEGPAGVSLRGQLEFEREEHRRIVQAKDEELQALAAQLDKLAADSNAESVAPQPAAAPAPAVATSPAARRAQPAVVDPPPVGAGPSPTVVAAPAQPRRAVVYADLLWVREGPGVRYLRLSALDQGVMVELSGNQADGWVEISFPERGWVASEFLEFLPSQPRLPVATSAVGGPTSPGLALGEAPPASSERPEAPAEAASDPR